MYVDKITEYYYDVICYDWEGGKGDCILGALRRGTHTTPDGTYWMFYPSRAVNIPLNYSDVTGIASTLIELNTLSKSIEGIPKGNGGIPYPGCRENEQNASHFKIPKGLLCGSPEDTEVLSLLLKQISEMKGKVTIDIF